jgi:26S proteasome non-ATPase regulatory subunit 9
MTTREKLNRLVAQRDALELEADAIASELNSPGPNNEPPAGIKTSLIDSEGFPRGDIDLFNVKAKRQRLATINTDHKLLMKELENTLHLVHSEMPLIESTSKLNIGEGERKNNYDTAKGFAIIDEILDTSPASEAGLKNGDELLAFGKVNGLTLDALNAVPSVVKDNVNKRIPLYVKRQGIVVSVFITPKPWGGRGLLGCHLTPITQM